MTSIIYHNVNTDEYNQIDLEDDFKLSKLVEDYGSLIVPSGSPYFLYDIRNNTNISISEYEDLSNYNEILIEVVPLGIWDELKKGVAFVREGFSSLRDRFGSAIGANDFWSGVLLLAGSVVLPTVFLGVGWWTWVGVGALVGGSVLESGINYLNNLLPSIEQDSIGGAEGSSLNIMPVNTPLPFIAGTVRVDNPLIALYPIYIKTGERAFEMHTAYYTGGSNVIGFDLANRRSDGLEISTGITSNFLNHPIASSPTEDLIKQEKVQGIRLENAYPLLVCTGTQQTNYTPFFSKQSVSVFVDEDIRLSFTTEKQISGLSFRNMLNPDGSVITNPDGSIDRRMVLVDSNGSETLYTSFDGVPTDVRREIVHIYRKLWYNKTSSIPAYDDSNTSFQDNLWDYLQSGQQPSVLNFTASITFEGNTTTHAVIVSTVSASGSNDIQVIINNNGYLNDIELVIKNNNEDSTLYNAINNVLSKGTEVAILELSSTDPAIDKYSTNIYIFPSNGRVSIRSYLPNDNHENIADNYLIKSTMTLVSGSSGNQIINFEHFRDYTSGQTVLPNYSGYNTISESDNSTYYNNDLTQIELNLLRDMDYTYPFVYASTSDKNIIAIHYEDSLYPSVDLQSDNLDLLFVTYRVSGTTNISLPQISILLKKDSMIQVDEDNQLPENTLAGILHRTIPNITYDEISNLIGIGGINDIVIDSLYQVQPVRVFQLITDILQSRNREIFTFLGKILSVPKEYSPETSSTIIVTPNDIIENSFKISLDNLQVYSPSHYQITFQNRSRNYTNHTEIIQVNQNPDVVSTQVLENVVNITTVQQAIDYANSVYRDSINSGVLVSFATNRAIVSYPIRTRILFLSNKSTKPFDIFYFDNVISSLHMALDTNRIFRIEFSDSDGRYPFNYNAENLLLIAKSIKICSNFRFINIDNITDVSIVEAVGTIGDTNYEPQKLVILCRIDSTDGEIAVDTSTGNRFNRITTPDGLLDFDISTDIDSRPYVLIQYDEDSKVFMNLEVLSISSDGHMSSVECRKHS